MITINHHYPINIVSYSFGSGIYEQSTDLTAHLFIANLGLETTDGDSMGCLWNENGRMEIDK